MADKPTAYYRLDETSGSAATDFLGTGHDLTYAAGATRNVTPGALSDGDAAASSASGTNLVVSGSDAGLPGGSSDRTVEEWVRASGTFGFTPVLQYGNPGVGGGGFTMYLQDTGRVAVNSDGGNSLQFNAPYPLNDGKWHFYAVTVASVNGNSQVTVYLDGQNMAVGSFNGLVSTQVPGNGLTIGGLNASYDEVAVYPTALSADRIAAHWTRAGGGVDCAAVPSSGYGGAVNADNPSVYLRLGDRVANGNTVVAYDSSKNCRNGTFATNAAAQPSGALAEADGAIAAGAGGVAARVSDTGLPGGSSDRTVEEWVRASGTFGFTPVLQYGNPGVGGGGFTMYLQDTGRVAVNSDGGNSLQFNAPYPLNDGKWHFYAVTVASVNGNSQVTVYLDGQNMAVGSFNGLVSTQVPGNGLTIGGLNASYDEVAVYPTALSADRIAAHWTRAGGGVDCAAVPSSGYGGAVNADNPSVYLRLGDRVANGNTVVAYDSSKNCRNGTFATNAAAQPSGALAEADGAIAAGAGGVAARVSDTGLPGGSSDRTVEEWVRASGTFGFTPVLQYGNPGVGGGGFTMYLQDTGRVAVNSDGGNSLQFNAPYPLNDGKWHFYAVTVASVNGNSQVTVYLDGQNMAVGSFNGLVSTQVPGNGLTIGGLNASYDEVAVYPTALSADRIAAHWTRAGGGVDCAAVPSSGYGGAVNADNPSVYLRLGDRVANGNTVVAYDSSKNCRNGTFATNAAAQPSGALAEADGAIAAGAGGVAARVSDTGLPGGSSDRTVEEWVRASGTFGFTPVLQYGNPGVGGGGFTMYLQDTGRVAVNSDGGNSLQFNAPYPLNDGKWHFYAVTVASVNGNSQVTVYLDGQNMAVGSFNGLVSTQVPGNGLTIGGLNASYDEVAVYPTALSADRIAAHYAARTAASSSTLTATTLAASPTTALQGDAIQLTATVTAPQGGPAPAQGTMTFTLRGATLGTAPLNSLGEARLTVTTLPVGANDVVASFPGTGSYLASSSAAATVTITAAPTPVVTATPTSGIAPLAVTLDASLAGASSTAAYTWAFGDGATGSGAHVTHTYAAGQFTAQVTVTDGGRTVTGTQLITVAAAEPLTAAAGDDQVTTTNTLLSFDGSGSRPAAGITAYTWAFGDGSTSSGATATHAYANPGTYTVTLTVTQGSATATDTAVVTVNTATPATGLTVTVTDPTGAKLSGADVVVIDQVNGRYTGVTDASGVVTLQGLPDASYSVYATATGYKPNVATATVTSAKGAATVVLDPGDIGTSTITATQLTPAQIVAAGIDPNAPANNIVYSFEAHLAFGPGTVLTGYVNGAGSFVGASTGGVCGPGQCTVTTPQYVATGRVIDVTGSGPTLQWLVIPGTAKYLKEFWNVSYVVLNAASTAFTFTGGQATLNLPAGLVLAPTATPQTLAQGMPDIPGGQSATATWTIRGDVEGSYTLGADYAASLYPLGTPVNLSATTATPLKVWGASAIQMVVDADDAAQSTYPYVVRIGLKNVSDTTVYNATVKLDLAGKLNFIYQPLQQLEFITPTIAAGTTFWTGDLVLVPTISGQLNLSKSFVRWTGGTANLADQIVSHPSPSPRLNMTAGPNPPGQVKLTWDPVPGATGYRVYRTSAPDVDFPATAVTGNLPAGTTTTTIPAAAGVTGFYAVSALLPGGVVRMYNNAVTTSGGVAGGPAGGPVGSREFGPGGNGSYDCSYEALHGCQADPVDTAYGTLLESFPGITIPGRGPALSWNASYTSAAATVDGPLGFGWTGSYAASAATDPTTGAVTITQENGAQVTFTKNPDGTYSAAPRVRATLATNATGGLTLVRKADQTLTFDPTGHLTSIADRNGETTTLTYTAGLLTTVTDPSGRSLTLTWTGTHVTRVTDPAARHVDYTYTPAGDLASITDLGGGITQFTYDGAHHIATMTDPVQTASPTPVPVVTKWDPQGRVSTQSDQLGRTTTFAYTGAPATVAGGTTLVTDPAGHQTLDTYSNGERLTSIAGYGQPEAVTTTYTYDNNTLGVTSAATSSAADPNNHRQTFTYNSDGLVITAVDGVGRETDTTYNAFREPLTTTSPNPSSVGPATITATYTYDTKGNLLTTSAPLYTSATASTAQTTTYVRGNAAHPGDVTAATDATGATTAYTYDTYGNVTAVTSPQGRKTTRTYDVIGRTLTLVTPAGNVRGAVAARSTTTYTYDGAGRVLSSSTANGTTPIVTKHTYDLNGQTLTDTDPMARTTSYTYDSAGQQTNMTRADGTVTATTYNPDGTLATQVDAAGNTTLYTEDSTGRTVSTTDPLGRTTTLTLDATGAVLTQTSPDHLVTTHTYDNAGGLLVSSYSDGTTPTVTRTYNAAGLPATMTDGVGTTTYTYDSRGRLTGNAAPAGLVRYAYNSRGQVTTLTYPNGKNVTRTYSTDGDLATVTDWLGGRTTFTYDQDNNLTRVVQPNRVTTTNTYDAPDRMTGQTFTGPNGTLDTFTYSRNNASEITREIPTQRTGTRNFTYNALGQLSALNASNYGYDKSDNLTNNAGVTSTYDAANQLVSSVAGITRTTYGYDPRGNRTSEAGATSRTYIYDGANELSSFSSGNVSAQYAYFGSGLRANAIVAGVKRSFLYDVATSELPLIVTDGVASYVYGAGGTPLEQITGSTATYNHADQLGSVRLVSNARGIKIGSATYDAYGQRTTNGTRVSLGFASQYTDAESGLIWMRARSYDPKTGEFLQVDLLGTITRELYSYAYGNPITRRDPSGLLTGVEAANYIATGSSAVQAVATTCALATAGTAAACDLADAIATGANVGANLYLGYVCHNPLKYFEAFTSAFSGVGGKFIDRAYEGTQEGVNLLLQGRHFSSKALGEGISDLKTVTTAKAIKVVADVGDVSHTATELSNKVRSWF